jgi:hypothetical protein
VVEHGLRGDSIQGGFRFYYKFGTLLLYAGTACVIHQIEAEYVLFHLRYPNQTYLVVVDA